MLICTVLILVSTYSSPSVLCDANCKNCFKIQDCLGKPSFIKCSLYSQNICTIYTLIQMLTLYIQGCAIASIIFGVIASDNVIYGIVGAIADIDLQNIVLWICIILAVLLVIMLCCTAGVAWKRICCLQYAYAFLITLCCLLFLALGIVIIIVAIVAADQLDEACTGSR